MTEEQTDNYGDLIEAGVVRHPRVIYECECGFSTEVYTLGDLQQFSTLKKQFPECPCCRTKLLHPKLDTSQNG